jgi:hypothetical protein
MRQIAPAPRRLVPKAATVPKVGMWRIKTLSITRVERRRDSLRLTPVALLVWSLLYALPHLYWGLGGTAGYFALRPSVPDTEGWEAMNLFAFVVITFAGFVGFGLERTQHLPRARMLLLMIAGAGCAIAASHGAYGILFHALSVVGFSEVHGQPFDLEKHGWVLWDMLAIEPWFLGEGILLGLAGYLSQRSAKGRRSGWGWWVRPSC